MKMSQETQMIWLMKRQEITTQPLSGQKVGFSCKENKGKVVFQTLSSQIVEQKSWVFSFGSGKGGEKGLEEKNLHSRHPIMSIINSSPNIFSKI